jgi:hypothetical protein
MYQPSFPWGAQVLLLPGVSCAIILVPGGSMGALLKSYCPKMCVAAEILGLILEFLSIFNFMTAWGSILSHKCIGKDLLVEHRPSIKWSLNDLIARSAEFNL